MLKYHLNAWGDSHTFNNFNQNAFSSLAHLEVSELHQKLLLKKINKERKKGLSKFECKDTAHNDWI